MNDIIYEINTPTVEDYIEVVRYFLEFGHTWSSGDMEIHPDYWWGENCHIQIHSYLGITCWSNHLEPAYTKKGILTIEDFYNMFLGARCKMILKEFK